MEHGKIIDKVVIHKEIEPGVINEEMMTKCILDEFKGEAGRLARQDPIRHEKVTHIRLEHLNILKIDHLWIFPNLIKLSLNFNNIDKIENLDMLVNLKELDLSFNYIEKIENLNNLVNLELLTLHSNLIQRIENIDTLTNLIILSIGQNKITSLNGLERLRFFKKLRSLNLENNPIATDKENPIREYVAALLPQLKFYHYVRISTAERTLGLEKYEHYLFELEEREKIEIAKRERTRKEIEDEINLSDSFVEFLNENQLFDSFFQDDTDGDALLTIGEEGRELVEKYREQAFDITQRIYKVGVERNKQRWNEINLFMESVNLAKIKIQAQGQDTVNEYLESKILKYDLVIKLLADIQQESHDEDAKYTALEKIHNLQLEMLTKFNDVWRTLMDIEINLFERVEEANSAFGHTIVDMINEFIEDAQSFFVQLRDAEFGFCEALQEAVMRFVQMKVASDTLPVELKACKDDKDNVSNLIAGMREHHLLVIDTREDRLVTRGRKWANDLINKLHEDEIKRNRNKVMEINYFIDQQRREFDSIIESNEDEQLNGDDGEE